VGAWIETNELKKLAQSYKVAPRVGAWIETQACWYIVNHQSLSHPAWVRGLKRKNHYQTQLYRYGRTPRGCVD